MSYEKKFVLEILKSNNIIPTKITKANISGQKKVFFITIGTDDYVFKMIDITPNELIDEYDGNISEFDEYQEDKNYILQEKITRIKNELNMAKKCKILPQLKLLDDYKTYEEDDGIYLYFIEERFKGLTLESFYKHRDFNINQVLDFIAQMVEIIQIMYNNKYIHRDIKPLNIIVFNNKYQLIDGGLCKNLSDELNITRTPDFIGTYRYAAPEQEKRTSNFEWDFTTDLFPVGLIAIELFIKEARKYSEEHLRDMEYIFEKWKTENLSINHVFSKLIVKLCSTNRARRFNDFEEIYSVLNQLKEGLL